jgi:hypothetical protein
MATNVECDFSGWERYDTSDPGSKAYGQQMNDKLPSGGSMLFQPPSKFKTFLSDEMIGPLRIMSKGQNVPPMLCKFVLKFLETDLNPMPKPFMVQLPKGVVGTIPFVWSFRQEVEGGVTNWVGHGEAMNATSLKPIQNIGSINERTVLVLIFSVVALLIISVIVYAIRG